MTKKASNLSPAPRCGIAIQVRRLGIRDCGTSKLKVHFFGEGFLQGAEYLDICLRKESYK